MIAFDGNPQPYLIMWLTTIFHDHIIKIACHGDETNSINRIIDALNGL